MTVINARVRKFGNNIDTDTITPGQVLHLSMEEIAQHVFEPVQQDFYLTVKAGDVILAGTNFGCGSSREQATAAVKELGFKYIVCESMARIYFRNCISQGIYPIIAPGVAGFFEEGDRLQIDLDQGRVINPESGRWVSFEPLEGTTQELFEGGGILPVLQKILSARRREPKTDV